MGVTNLNKFDSPLVLTASGTVGPTSTPRTGPALVGRSFLTLSLKDMDYKSNRWLRIDSFKVFVSSVPVNGTDSPVVNAMPGIIGFQGNLNSGSVRGIQTGFFLNMALRVGEFEIAEDVPLPMFAPRTQVASERELSQIGSEGGTFFPRRSSNHYTIPLGAPLFVPPNYIPSIVLRRPGDGSPYHRAFDTTDNSSTITQMRVDFAACGARVKEPSREDRRNMRVPWFDVFRAVKDDAQWPPERPNSQNLVMSVEQQMRNHFHKKDLYVARVMGRMLSTPYLEPRDMDTEDRKYQNGFDSRLNFCLPGSQSNTQFGGFNPQLEIFDTQHHKVVNACNWRNIFSPQTNSFHAGQWCLKPLERLTAKIFVPDVPMAVGLTPNPLADNYFSILNRCYVGISGWREERV